MKDEPFNLRAPNLQALPHIMHGFFTRQGGVSKGAYQSLNCGWGSGDRAEDITANRARIAHALGIAPDRLITARQTHSATALIVRDRPDREYVADALVSDQSGLALAVLTADCAPILLADPKRHICAAAHAGWRGAIAGITDEAIAQMVHLGAQRADIIAAIGPHIGAAVYQIGADVHAQICAAAAATEMAAHSFLTPASGEKWLFDLGLYLKARLAASGVREAIILPGCTMSAPERFFSYRASRAAGGANYGRQLSAILLS